MELGFEKLSISNDVYPFKGGVLSSQYVISDILPYAAKTMSNLISDNEKSKDTIKIELIKQEDGPEVLTLLKKFFFKDEPLNNYLNLGECVDLEEYSLKCIPENCSYKAVNSEGEIVGVMLNAVLTKPEPDYVPGKAADDCTHPKFKKILQLMDYIETQFDLFKNYPDCDKILDLKIMSVDTSYRGQNIGAKLTEATLKYMRDNNIPLMHVMCSSHFSARVMEKLGCDLAYVLAYRDFKVNGVNTLLPADPHTHCKIYIKRIK